MGRLMSMIVGGQMTPAMDEITLACIFPNEYLQWRGFVARPTDRDVALVAKAIREFSDLIEKGDALVQNAGLLSYAADEHGKTVNLKEGFDR